MSGTDERMKEEVEGWRRKNEISNWRSGWRVKAETGSLEKKRKRE